MVTIYAIVCIESQRAYIGATSGKLSKRYREHRCLAKSGKHTSKKFVEEWRKYGEKAFFAQPLQFLPDGCPLVMKREAELKWLRYYEADGRLLNDAVVSFSPTPEAIEKGIEAARHVTGRKNSPEANEKRRQAQLGKPKNHGAKISATKQAQKRARLTSEEIV